MITCEKLTKQAGADLCQAQAQVSIPVVLRLLNQTVEFQIWVLLEKTYNYI